MSGGRGRVEVGDCIAAPFPWFGGKRKVAADVWSAFGFARNYVEPFFGSGAVLLGRPGGASGVETVNDLDGYIANFWRAVAKDPEAVAAWADWPVNENDLHARHVWLLAQRDDLVPRLEGDPDYCDAKIAGWWVWGICSWIGSGWCSSTGPWQSIDGRLVRLAASRGVNRQRPHLGDDGQGINRKRRKSLAEYMTALGERLRGVRVCCGDWTRVCGPSVTFKHGVTAVFFDPPYCGEANRDMRLYGENDSGAVAADVRGWCAANGDNPLLRIALCGYEGEGHEELTAAGWRVMEWNAGAGYGGQGGNHQGRRERIWFSPHCTGANNAQPTLWEDQP